MREQLLRIKDRGLETWSQLANRQKVIIIGIIVLLLVSLILLISWASKPEYATLYTNLSQSETGEIVSEIESRGIPVQIAPDGRSVSVPRTEVERLKVELAYAGIPRSGNINYSVFSENMGFGTTDRQFDVVERDAMQNELRYLIEQIDGIDQAKVMITLPKESVWLMNEEQAATASVLLTTRQGLELNQVQVQGLYHLISKSVPQLPVENIVVMDQNWGSYELADPTELDTTLSQHQQQRQVIRDIERDIQRELQQMLGIIMGQNRVVVSVFANVNFDRETREEHLVTPTAPDTNEGIAVSIERIQESFEGQGGTVGGIPGTGDGDIAGYQGAEGSGDSEYERIEERINRDVNRIFRNIVASPYTIEDLTINVGFEPVDPETDSEETVEGIRGILRSVVSTYMSTSSVEFTQDELDQKINVFTSTFSGTPEFETPTAEANNIWLYILGGVAALAIGALAYVLIRNRRKNEEAEAEEEIPAAPFLEEFDFDQENEETARRKRIERLAKNKPEEFVKLLRTWLADD
ncbi:flagellar basal-body MS-ring/collar protein FliF [Bacillus horti]|uniref:Flagellar M-ring protein n=1 Tax=Caldalkalibacillus horti TaxID=77523 RepID=A0ABT9VUV1_9BACI|nr:flagellar basal-body MS-ring/collar protein FliF [Bacillus horti]MDQ0164660.1 flagellar M-ring protein FliF [Bacillus horti]